ncbi:SUMO1 sentrin specific peptidase 8 [Homalodisca vitripennis]|nr:SUMO1 sentrin specific peptidase 8 [Homalodisca vitripennis]
MVKLGAEDDAKALLSQVSLSSSHYVFCCVSNNVATLKDDSGTHWSLLFVDVAGGAAYHFDSLNQSNNLSAKLTASKLGVEKCNFTEISCMQQKNSFECGISVLVNTRLVTEGFCARGPTSQCSFMDWYRNFFTPDFTADKESSDRLSDGSLVLPLLSCASPSKVESLPVNNVFAREKTFPGGCSPVSAVPGDFRAVPEVSQASVQHKESGNGIRGASCFPE